MKKKILSVLLCLCMVLTLLPDTVWAAQWNVTHTHYLCGGDSCNGAGHESESSKTTFATEIKQENGKLYKDGTEWEAKLNGSYSLDGGTYYLSTDIKSNGNILINGDVKLCLHGNSITFNTAQSKIHVSEDAAFTLTDCVGGGKITHSESTKCPGVITNGIFHMYGGNITGNTNDNGGGVYVSNGKFEMYGGSITGNRATNIGGGVYVSNGKFEMYGGNITGNTADNGGGVFVGSGCTFNMYGGSIGGTTENEDNTATYYGGGVYVTGGTFNMTGGNIIGNTTDSDGGGVFVDNNGSFTMSASANGKNIPSITGNNANSNGGGVYVYSGTFEMTGGSITGNNVSVSYGSGGIYISGNAKKFTVSGNIQITGNLKMGTKNEIGKYTGGNVENLYLPKGKTVTIGGGLTEGAQLGVTLGNNYGDKAFTSGWKTNMGDKNPSVYFISDVAGKGFELSGEEVKLSDGHTHYLCGGKTCNGAGHTKETGKTTFATEIRQENGELKKDGSNWNSTTDNYKTYYDLPAGTYYLGSDIDPKTTIKITGDVTLCLNGHTIKKTADDQEANSYQDGVIIVAPNCTFTLTDCWSNGTVTHADNKTGRGVHVDANGTFNMYGGSITGNNTDTGYYGGGVLLNESAKFNMYGGKISNNTAYNGGGVYIHTKSAFTMTDGSITGNGAVGIDANSAEAGRGGGVCAYGDNGTFTMTGGSITGNNTNSAGGGVYVCYSSFVVSGDVKVTGNTTGATKGEDGKFAGGTANNVCLNLYEPNTITIGNGGLSYGAKLGVTLNEIYDGQPFTSGWKTQMSDKDPSDYFISDDSSRTIVLSGGEVKLRTSHAHYLCGRTCSHTTEDHDITFDREIRQDTDGKLYIDDTEWTASNGAYSLAAGKYYLATDLTLDEGIEIKTKDNASAYLCLNGKTVSRANDGEAVKVVSGHFYLTDCSGGKITHASDKTGSGVYVAGGSFGMYNGSITDNNGSGVLVGVQGKFYMYNGSITGNNANSNGGGVLVNTDGIFEMHDGTVKGNNAANGGGVYVSGSFYMSGGSITGNNANSNGGGVYVNGTFVISGAVEIRNNVKGGYINSGSYTDGTANNVYIPAYRFMNIGDTLINDANDAKIGITLGNNYGEGHFTSGWGTYMDSYTPSNYFKSDVDGYKAVLDGYEVKLVSTHEHSWTYTASGDTITATCKNCEVNNGQDFVGGKAQITALDATFNGKIKTATVSGTGIFYGANIDISYSKYNATSEQFESTNVIPAFAGRYKASITYGGATATVEYTINKATREAPEDLTVSPADSVGGKGKINGTKSGTFNEVNAMEYNASATATTGWKDCSDDSTEVAPGTYYVRYKENRNYLASAAVEVTVAAHTHTFIDRVDDQYLKSAANCQSSAVYYKSCSDCGATSEDTFTNGDLNRGNHTTIVFVGQKAPTCCEPGNTGRKYCLACQTGITVGSEIPATGEHVDADGKWESDGTSHWHTCYFNTKFDLKTHSGGEASCNACAVCEECGQPYGAFDSDNHKHTELRNVKAATEQDKGYSGDTWCLDCGREIEPGHETDKLTHQLKEVAAKAATAAEQGNIKYYFCSGCGKYYADAEGKQELTREQTLLPKLAPEITEGGNTTVSSGEKKALTFRSDAAFADFLRVELDGKTLDEKNYTKAEGGIVVTLNGDFVATLSVGEHTLSIVSQSGTATAKFTVNAAQTPTQTPKTGDSSVVAVWSLAALLSLALGVTVVSKKKRER